ncbi:hypothetical protein A3C23_03445 [Candidatus Roizmanbacteria bacterium RIFCSPHIGHO2_02_FULL_37_13b]|uniref:Cell shape-determining protein MreB n=1 Tax=Candidatus Roizmanbacteria bacterium RIFCSPLOWO2_02_FULL_36_11 TaxID=1802071 RepID=A0A1F7JBY9_9BACT|nr:MAG: hypothetical protein A3C23_03445 [Candidatus Roizmanbacteria bacterium RIFCSPHIGHO2_02_FULL_37_13b]OGK53157.1 MAG: hypothetical protein A3H78_02130 [Candidatus Roizmanbacteria bacterium RIFCSPLOWO2_02_FULL_36_11]
MQFKPFFKKFENLANSLLGSADIAIDLGTSMTRLGIFSKGIVLREPSYIGQNTRTNDFLFFGEEAKEIFGKAPNFIHITKPIEHSIISDFDKTVLLLKHFMDKSVYPFFLNRSILKNKLYAYAVVPTPSTEVEQKATIEALAKVGISETYLIEKPLAIAAGANLAVFSKNPYFVIDLGGGSIEMAVVVMGGIVTFKTLKNAGEQMDKLLYNYLHLKNGIIIGDQTSEQLKISSFSLLDDASVMTVRGKSLENGLPKSIRVRSTEVKEALINNLNQIIDSAKEMMETVPPEIVDGIIKNGLTLTGGMANIKGINRYFSNELKIPVEIPEKPQDCTISGILKLLEQPDKLRQIIINK